MSEREVEPILDKLREAEHLVLLAIGDEKNRPSWKVLQDCKVLIWKAMDSAADAAREGLNG